MHARCKAMSAPLAFMQTLWCGRMHRIQPDRVKRGVVHIPTGPKVEGRLESQREQSLVSPSEPPGAFKKGQVYADSSDLSSSPRQPVPPNTHTATRLPIHNQSIKMKYAVAAVFLQVVATITATPALRAMNSSAPIGTLHIFGDS